MKGTERWITIVVASVLVLLILFGMLLLWLGLIESTGEIASTQIIVATLVLIGTLATSAVSSIGILLKHSFDQRNAEMKEREQKRLDIESTRNSDLRKDAEKRLKLETAVQAVNLLSTSSGENVPMIQRAGVLFTLANLEQEALAINLARQMVDDNNIDVKTVDWLIDHALRSKDESTRDEACSLLDDVICTLFVQERGEKVVGFQIPYCLAEWDPGLSQEVIRRGLQSILSQTLSRPRSMWPEHSLKFVIACLATHWQGVKDKTLRNSIGICLEKMLDIEKLPEGISIATIPGTLVDIDSIKQEVLGLNEQVQDIQHWVSYRDFAEKIDEWGST